MSQTAVIHIGTEKTGTTTIQHFLRVNRKRLAARGDFVPETLGPVTHTRLATFAEAGGDPDEDGPQDGEGTSDAARDAMRRAFETEMADLPRGVARALFSSEHLHRRLRSAAEVARLRDILSPHFADFRVIVYLRRQDRLAASLYSTKIRYGGTWDMPVMPARRAARDHYWNYRVFLEKWIEVFGRDNVTVRIFEPRRLREGDVLADFCEAAEIDLTGLEIPSVKNPSLSPAALMVLGKLNEDAPRRGEVLIRENFIRTLEEHFNSSKQIVPRREAQKFYELFRESNRWVRDNFFPHYPESLFDEDFSGYPDAEQRLQPALGDVMAVFACLWEAQRAQRHATGERIRELEAALQESAAEPGLQKPRRRLPGGQAGRPGPRRPAG